MHLDVDILCKWLIYSGLRPIRHHADLLEPVESLIITSRTHTVNGWPIEVHLSIQRHEVVPTYEPSGKFDWLELLITFPYHVEEGELYDTYQLVNLLNRVSPLAGFGYDSEISHSFYRSEIPVTGKQDDHKRVMAHLNFFLDCAESYGKAVQVIGEGEVGFDELKGFGKR